MKVLIINGAPRSGKDTFAKYLFELNNSLYSYSSIDWVKKIAGIMGWDGIKDERGRQFLSDIKEAAVRYDDIPFKKVVDIGKTLMDMGVQFYAVNVREPVNIEKLKKYYQSNDVPCHSVLITNKVAEEKAKEFKNTGDSSYMNYSYDYCIENNSSLDQFRRNIIDFLEVEK